MIAFRSLFKSGSLDRGLAAVVNMLKVYWPVLLPFAIYLVRSLVLRSWIIDDAGISFDYSRSLAEGHGLVLQPGVPPVEGYSNFLWVVLTAPWIFVHQFDPIHTPKLISYVLVFLTFLSIFRALTLLKRGPYLIAVILGLLSISTSFIVWTVSGLENPLYACLIAALFLVSVRDYVSGRDNTRSALLNGLIASLIALTRPDGSIFLIVYPLLLVSWNWKKGSMRTKLACLLSYASVVILLFGGYFLFRVLYFHDVVPNTFRAKGGISRENLKLLLTSELVLKIRNLISSVSSRYVSFILSSLVVVGLYMVIRKKCTREHFLLTVFLGFSTLPYILLPGDWMGEYRFATPFYMFFYMFLAVFFVDFVATLPLEESFKLLLVLTVLVMGTQDIASTNIKRLQAFSARPTVPFNFVLQNFGGPYDKLASRLHITNASILLPDIGGTAWGSKLRIYDLAGLTDKTIAQTRGTNQQEFYNYVFETAQPTFIHTCCSWAHSARLDLDPRFRKMYTPLTESNDPDYKVPQGDYVLKSVLKGTDPAELTRILLREED